MMILAIGNSSVYEVESFKEVEKNIKKRGDSMLLFKQDNCLKGEYLSFVLNEGKLDYNIIIDGKKYNISDFSSIWYIKPRLPKELLFYDQVEYRAFIQKQFLEMRRTIWDLFKHKKWLNDPWSMIIAENKPYQLVVASEVGFHVPNTVVTSDPLLVKDFYDQNKGDIIVKILSPSPILDHVIYTNKVTPQYMEKISSVVMSPSIFQETIAKAYELRITVVGDRIFPVKINSQLDEDTMLDWRRKPKLNDFKVRMEETILPDSIKKKIFSFMKKMGLNFGCIDMIVTKEEEYVFLEVNSNGQWYFVQLKTGAKIAEAIADQLLI